MYPTFDQIKNLHKKYASSDELFDLVFTHCQIVWEISEQIIIDKNLQLNRDLVQAGALLHDIATYKYLSLPKDSGGANYYRHAFEGAQILRDEKMPEDLCLLVERHLGVGLSKEEILKRNMDLPAQDFIPQTIEERLVSYADKFHSKTPKFNRYETYEQYASTFGESTRLKFEALAKEFGTPEIEELATKYNHPIK